MADEEISTIKITIQHSKYSKIRALDNKKIKRHYSQKARDKTDSSSKNFKNFKNSIKFQNYLQFCKPNLQTGNVSSTLLRPEPDSLSDKPQHLNGYVKMGLRAPLTITRWLFSARPPANLELRSLASFVFPCLAIASMRGRAGRWRTRHSLQYHPTTRT